MIYASTFLSHSSEDKPLVEKVAHELGRRGIIAWLDKNELQSGASLSMALQEAVQRQATVTVFLSEAAIKSRWVEDELAAALQKDDASHERERIIPIYLGEPVSLVSSHPLLRNRWLHPDGNRVDRLGIAVPSNTDPLLLAQSIASEVARRVYSTLQVAEKRDIIIYLDQRGMGIRRGEPENIPENVRQLDAPVLVFRPNLSPRSPDETLHGKAWQDMRLALESSLAEALRTPRWSTPKKIRILGNTQLGFPFFLGRYFNRNTTAQLFCTNVDGRTFHNQDQPRSTPLQGGNPYCQASHPDLPPMAINAQVDTISLLLSTRNYVAPVLRYLSAHPGAPPVVWIQSGVFETNGQVMQYIADVVALLVRFSNEHGICTVYLYCSLPFHVVPLLAANLLHVVENIIFMEYRRDLQGKNPHAGETYVPL